MSQGQTNTVYTCMSYLDSSSTLKCQVEPSIQFHHLICRENIQMSQFHLEFLKHLGLGEVKESACDSTHGLQTCTFISNIFRQRSDLALHMFLTAVNPKGVVSHPPEPLRTSIARSNVALVVPGQVINTYCT